MFATPIKTQINEDIEIQNIEEQPIPCISEIDAKLELLLAKKAEERDSRRSISEVKS